MNRTAKGLSPLAVAAMSGSLEVVEMLCALGAQPGDHDVELLALQRGHTERSPWLFFLGSFR